MNGKKSQRKIELILQGTAIVSLILIANFSGARQIATIVEQWQQN